MHGGEKSAQILNLPPAPSVHHEYGSLALTLELVDSLDEAIDHIHAHGSAHTESIVTGRAARCFCGCFLPASAVRGPARCRSSLAVLFERKAPSSAFPTLPVYRSCCAAQSDRSCCRQRLQQQHNSF